MVKVGNKCNSVPNGVQFVDESAIEIDIADDDDVCVVKEERLDCANILDSLKHKRGDESADNELIKQGHLQFEATFSGMVVENDLISDHMTSQPSPRAETSPNFHRPHIDGGGDKGNVEKLLNGCHTTKDNFVDERSVEIDVADDEDSRESAVEIDVVNDEDSCDSVVVIADDSDSDIDSVGSIDVNVPQGTADSLSDNGSHSQKDVPSKQARSGASSRRKSSSASATVSFNKRTPVASRCPRMRRSQRTATVESYNEDLLVEYNLQRLKIVSSADAIMSPEIVFDELDLEHLQKPFTCGWRRELVCRRVSKNRSCDVYYKSPEGKKMRSKIELATYLNSVTNSPVNLTHFTFKKVLLFNPPMEFVRLAGSRSLQKLDGQSNSAESEAQSQDCSSEANISTKQAPTEDHCAANIVAADPFHSLTSVTCVVGQDLAEKNHIPYDRMSTSSFNVPEASQLSYQENSAPQSKKPTQQRDKQRKNLRKRMHETSPEWTCTPNKTTLVLKKKQRRIN